MDLMLKLLVLFSLNRYWFNIFDIFEGFLFYQIKIYQSFC